MILRERANSIRCASAVGMICEKNILTMTTNYKSENLFSYYSSDQGHYSSNVRTRYRRRRRRSNVTIHIANLERNARCLATISCPFRRWMRIGILKYYMIDKYLSRFDRYGHARFVSLIFAVMFSRLYQVPIVVSALGDIVA